MENSAMVLRALLASVFALFFAHAAAAGQPPPKTAFPTISDEAWAQWQRLLVVAELDVGDYHLARECPKKEGEVIICMDPPPSWFKASVSSTLYGAAAPAELRASTTSHAGKLTESEAHLPYLVSLRTDGETYVMPRYAKLPLIRNKQGALFLQVTSRYPTSWLPCDVSTLIEEIFPEDFDGKHGISGDGLKYRVSQGDTELFKMTGKSAWFRFAIPIDRLRDFLQQAAPGGSLACEFKSGQTIKLPTSH
jgi:hypothetical protein